MEVQDDQEPFARPRYKYIVTNAGQKTAARNKKHPESAPIIGYLPRREDSGVVKAADRAYCMKWLESDRTAGSAGIRKPEVSAD